MQSLNRTVKLAVVQPPAWSDGKDGRDIQAIGLELFDQAAADYPDVICLPEYFNCMDCPAEAYTEKCGHAAQELLDIVLLRAKSNGCYVVLPLVIDVKGHRYNRAHLLGRDGRVVGTFDKVHVTEVERTEMGIEAGNQWPVFDLDFGRVGIMICYDGCFSESSRVLALAGAKVIFWPSLQRSYSRNDLELQMRSHAYFNYSVVVRSSYGGAMSGDPEAPSMVGLSGVCGDDGVMLAALDGRAGWSAAEMNVAQDRRGSRTFGGQLGSLRKMRFEDRCPATYMRLTEKVNKRNLNNG
ncbi:MAG: carbon-nitrogen hydrolase family protein [Kiritimatiellae bacterium]|nr:carbon-nitrogen hydrolase family protein [Kiritimatiellia bacterium]